MDLSVPGAAASELAAAFFLGVVLLGLAILFFVLHRRYRKRYLLDWAVAWSLYALRSAAIITFIAGSRPIWLYWHQVLTGWTALAFLWASLDFSRQMRWRPGYFLLGLFPVVWSYLAIYRLDDFLLAAGPAVAFLSGATMWAGWVFIRHNRLVGARAAAFVGWAFLLWGLHHLDYPFLRGRGVWVPWGYYLDVLFVLAVAVGILLLVQEDLERGMRALSALSGDLQRVRTGDAEGEGEVPTELLERPLTLPAVRGSALVEVGEGGVVSVRRGAGLCAGWSEEGIPERLGATVVQAVAERRPLVVHGGEGRERALEYGAVLPLLARGEVLGALVVVGRARDPFAALDTPFLVTLGQQVGAALESARLHRRLEARTRELEHLARRMVHQHEEERRRLSRELHDETAQLFAAVNLQLGLAAERVDPGVADHLERARALVGEGIGAIRRLMDDLRPSLLDDLGLLPALRALSEDFAERSAIETRFEGPLSLPPLGEDEDLALFRALQEALSNVARHSGARAVQVTLDRREGEIVLRVRDDGSGLGATGEAGDSRGAAASGLQGMRERITALGGSLQIVDHAQGGVEVTVRIPEGR